ncbi:MAG: Gfo/Idh/MocA family oxidoreductase [Candidatus Lokiarchaeota archaeon]
MGFIGIGYKNFLPLKALGYINDEECEIIALSHHSIEVAHDIISKGNLPASIKYYTKYEEMLSKESLDIVEILLPYKQRSEAIIKAISRGVGVISLQNPLAMNLEEAKMIIKYINKSDSILVPYETSIFNPYMQKVKSLLEEDYIGELTSIRIKLSLLGSNWKNEINYWRNQKNQDSINIYEYPILFAYGSHTLTLADWFCKEDIERVFAWNGKSEGFDVPTYIMFKFTQNEKHIVPQYGNIEIGYIPNIDKSSTQLNIDEFIEIIGTRGLIRINKCSLIDSEPFNSNILAPIVIIRDGKVEVIDNFVKNWETESFINTTKNCINVAKGTKIPIFSYSKALEILKIILAAIKSVEIKSEVNIYKEQ